MIGERERERVNIRFNVYVPVFFTHCFHPLSVLGCNAFISISIFTATPTVTQHSCLKPNDDNSDHHGNNTDSTH